MVLTNRKKLAIIVASLVVLGGIIFGVIVVNKQSQPKFINYRDPHFTTEENRSLEDKVTTLKDQIKQLPKRVSNDDRYKLYFQLGLTHYSLGQYSLAKDAYKQATQILPNNSTAWSELYVVEVAMEDYSSAQNSIDKAIEQNPTSAKLWRYKIELKQKHLNVSMTDTDKLFKDALIKTNSAVDIITSYAQFLEQKGDLSGAIQQWRAAIEKNPSAKDLYDKEISRVSGARQ